MAEVVRVKRAQQALHDVVDAVFSSAVSCIWEGQRAPRPELPRVTLGFTVPPGPSGRGHQDVRRVLPKTATMTVAAAVADQSFGLVANGTHHRHESDGTDKEAVRDALLALIAASEEPVSAAANGSYALDLDRDHLGALESLYCYPADLELVVTDTETVKETGGRRDALVSFDCASRTTDGELTAAGIAATLQTALFAVEHRSVLRAAGIGLSTRVSPPRDLSDLDGPEEVGRVQFDIPINLRARYIKPAGPAWQSTEWTMEVSFS